MSEADAKTKKPGRRNVLVISSVERPVEVLREALGGNIDELKVVVPAVKQSRLQWLTNADDDAREEAEDAAASIDDATPRSVEAEAGDADPLQAAEDALADFEPTSSWSSLARTKRRPGSRKVAPRTSSAAFPGSR